jgi:hypothetical protein
MIIKTTHELVLEAGLQEYLFVYFSTCAYAFSFESPIQDTKQL